MSLTAPHRGLRRGTFLVLAVLLVVLVAGLVIAATTGGRSTPRAVAQQRIVGLPSPGPLSDAPHPLPSAAASAARGFLPGYLAYVDGSAGARQIRDASPGLIDQLARNGPAVTAAASRQPFVVALGAQEATGMVLHVTALVSNGISRYPLRFVMVHERSGWEATQLANPE